MLERVTTLPLSILIQLLKMHMQDAYSSIFIMVKIKSY